MVIRVLRDATVTARALTAASAADALSATVIVAEVAVACEAALNVDAPFAENVSEPAVTGA